MAPRVVAISGPLAGAVLEMADGEIAIGRDPSNAVCLAYRAVSMGVLNWNRNAGSSAHHDQVGWIGAWLVLGGPCSKRLCAARSSDANDCVLPALFRNWMAWSVAP